MCHGPQSGGKQEESPSISIDSSAAAAAAATAHVAAAATLHPAPCTESGGAVAPQLAARRSSRPTPRVGWGRGTLARCSVPRIVMVWRHQRGRAVNCAAGSQPAQIEPRISCSFADLPASAFHTAGGSVAQRCRKATWQYQRLPKGCALQNVPRARKYQCPAGTYRPYTGSATTLHQPAAFAKRRHGRYCPERRMCKMRSNRTASQLSITTWRSRFPMERQVPPSALACTRVPSQKVG